MKQDLEGGFEKFQKAILEAAQAWLRPAFEERRDELKEFFGSVIFGLDGPKPPDRKIGAREQCFGKVFHGFLEIAKSLETLEDIAVYVSVFPFRGTRIPRERYLQFCVEAYYSEIYILRERLQKYLTLLERQHKGDIRLPALLEQCRALRDFIAEILKEFVELRGQHVHHVRFSDECIDRLATLGILSSSPDLDLAKVVKERYQKEHRKIRKIWKDRIQTNNKSIRQLLDIFFGRLFPMVFDETKHTFNYPSRLRATGESRSSQP